MDLFKSLIVTFVIFGLVIKSHAFYIKQQFKRMHETPYITERGPVPLIRGHEIVL